MKQNHPLRRKQPVRLLAAIGLLFFFVLSVCRGQGTITFTFEGQPRGTQQQIGVYSESGTEFGSLTPQSIYLSGGGIPGYPDNGTGYLEIPEGSMRFGYNTFPPTGTVIPFNLVSFDAAEYDSAGPTTLEVVGYKIQIMAPILTVTNYFTVSSQTFQTFDLDSSFSGVFQVDVLNASWSLDNIVISGVPEPGPSALLALGAGLLQFRLMNAKGRMAKGRKRQGYFRLTLSTDM